MRVQTFPVYHNLVTTNNLNLVNTHVGVLFLFFRAKTKREIESQISIFGPIASGGIYSKALSRTNNNLPAYSYTVRPRPGDPIVRTHELPGCPCPTILEKGGPVPVPAGCGRRRRP
jgi:hypothetical protein